MPATTSASLYRRLQQRFGPWGMAKLGTRKMLGLKI
jgi:hypothetical protein